MAESSKKTDAPPKTNKVSERQQAKMAKHDERMAKSKYRAERKRLSQETSTTVNTIGLVVVLLLGVSIISTLATGQPKTFQSLLQVLGSVPSVDFGWLNFGEIVLNFPDWLAWAEVIIDVVIQLVSVLGFFLAGILQALMFILYFLQWVFL